MSAGFGGLRVVAFESRRAVEMVSLIERHGGVAIAAPTMREVPLTDAPDALAFAQALASGEIDAVVLMTGIGTRTLAASIRSAMPREDLVGGLERVRVIARGPKPAAVLRELGLTGFTTVPEPNTWREVLAALADLGLVQKGRRIAVQEHGTPSRALYDALRDAGADVSPIGVYRWALPDDTTPLRRALAAIAEGSAKIALLTSATQLEHALRIAGEEGIEDAVREALARGCIGSIGPVCSEALRGEGLEPDVEPAHPKMGHLVKEASERAGEVLARKANR